MTGKDLNQSWFARPEQPLLSRRMSQTCVDNLSDRTFFIANAEQSTCCRAYLSMQI